MRKSRRERKKRRRIKRRRRSSEVQFDSISQSVRSFKVSSDASELLDQRQPVSSESEQQEVPPQHKNHQRLTVSKRNSSFLLQR